MLFVVKEGSSDYKKVKKNKIKSRFFKEPLTEWFFVEPKKVLLYASLWKTFWSTFILRVYYVKLCVCVQVKNNMQIMYTIL